MLKSSEQIVAVQKQWQSNQVIDHSIPGYVLMNPLSEPKYCQDKEGSSCLFLSNISSSAEVQLIPFTISAAIDEI